MINYIKSELKHLPFVILVVICLYGFKVFADSYALSSMEVSFDNTGTNIQATNMQSAINEVYQHATDYNEIKTAIGSSTLTTTDKTLIGAVNELNTNKVNTSAIANNLTTTTEGLVLDARQGKALSDQIAQKQVKLISRSVGGSAGSQWIELTVNSGETLIGGFGYYYPVSFEYNPSTGKYYAYCPYSIPGGDGIYVKYFLTT